MPIPYGYCHCGCGGKTRIASETRKWCGHVKGEPVRFIHNHHGRVPLETRFWSKVDQRGPDECWEWTASRNQFGYGQIMLGAYGTGGKARPFFAHRIAWELIHGPIETGLFVLHRCDNPPCVNPAHLFLGDQSDNMKDAHAKGRTRQTFAIGHKGSHRTD
jgi:hypothetical protein